MATVVDETNEQIYTELPHTLDIISKLTTALAWIVAKRCKVASSCYMKILI